MVSSRRVRTLLPSTCAHRYEAARTVSARRAVQEHRKEHTEVEVLALAGLVHGVQGGQCQRDASPQVCGPIFEHLLRAAH